jgi:hypothetical protein
MTIDEIVKLHYADLMWALTVKEAEIEKLKSRIKELDNTTHDPAEDKDSDER